MPVPVELAGGSIRMSHRNAISSDRVLFKREVQSKTPNFICQHVEAGWSSRLKRVLALNHRLVNLRSTFDIITLNSEQLLENVGSSMVVA
jgi:hypothetical protein